MHLDEAQIKSLFEQNALKLELPRPGMREQWANVISTLVIAGLLIGMIYYQTNLGRGKSSRIRERPTVTFRDVAGIEEAKSEVQEIVDFLRDPGNISGWVAIYLKAFC
jgi:ATP-dependent Zn protease